LKGGPVPKIDSAYSETYFAQMHAENLHASQMKERFKWGWNAIDSLISIRTMDRKLICTADGEPKPIHLYRLDTDPSEENDLIDDPDSMDDIKELRQKLMALVGDDMQFRYETVKGEVKGIKGVIRKGRLKGI
jgi:arylsulfatase A-like enzyme